MLWFCFLLVSCFHFMPSDVASFCIFTFYLPALNFWWSSTLLIRWTPSFLRRYLLYGWPYWIFLFLEICRAGRFYNNSKSRCDLCPPETFSADDAITCAACPGSTTTYGKNAASQCHGGWIIKSIALSIECTRQIRKNLVMHILVHNLMVLLWM